jgi:H+-transporting ATPase
LSSLWPTETPVTFLICLCAEGVGSGHCSVLGNALVIVVGGVPIAMPTVVSVTLALGAQQLAKQKAIVRRITAVEELAGMDMLCSDKTGTLTKNRLSVAEPIPYDGEDPEDVIIKAALASARDTDDAIDNAMYDNIEEDRKNELENYTVLEYKPFDPVSKRSMAKVRDNNGKVFYVTKGAPQIIESMSTFENPLVSKEIHEHIQVLAEHGYRALGVAISDDGTKWKMLGLIPMFDPPRDDTKETIQKIRELGVRIKMITGDQVREFLLHIYPPTQNHSSSFISSFTYACTNIHFFNNCVIFWFVFFGLVACHCERDSTNIGHGRENLYL